MHAHCTYVRLEQLGVQSNSCTLSRRVATTLPTHLLEAQVPTWKFLLRPDDSQLLVSKYIYICIYIYMCVYIYICIYIYVYIYIYIDY